MVDINIAWWVKNNCDKHNRSTQCGVILKAPKTYISERDAKEQISLNVSQYPFVHSWIEWCRSKARRLSVLGGEHWRARDVEMAIFAVQRECKRQGGVELPAIS